MTAIPATVDYEERSTLDILIASLAVFLLAVQLANLATFNHQPDKLRLALGGLSVIGYAVLLASSLLYARGATMVHLVGLVLFCMAAAISLGLDPEHAKLSAFVGEVTSPMLLGMLTMRRTPTPGRGMLNFLWCVAVAAGLLAATLALTGPHFTKAGQTRLALIAGGDTGLHPSAYATACMLLTLFLLWRVKAGLSWLTPPLLLLLAFVVFRYEVRTVWVMLIVLIGYAAFWWMAQRSPPLLLGAAGLALIGGVAVLLLLSTRGFDLAHFSSGRTLIYAERLKMIEARDLSQVLFGTGTGTDLARGVTAWRWEEKNSHNDFMMVTIELGLVGLLGFLLMIGSAIWALPPSRKGWMLMIVTSSLISNGVLFRPSIGAPFVLVAWLSFALREGALRTAEIEEEEAWIEEDVFVHEPPGALAFARPD